MRHDFALLCCGGKPPLDHRSVSDVCTRSNACPLEHDGGVRQLPLGYYLRHWRFILERPYCVIKIRVRNNVALKLMITDYEDIERFGMSKIIRYSSVLTNYEQFCFDAHDL